MELLLVGSKSTFSKVTHLTLPIVSSLVSSSPQVNCLDVILNRSLSFQFHINNIAWSAYFHLCDINRSCPTLTAHSPSILVHSLVTGPVSITVILSLFLQKKQQQPHKLQLVHNSGAFIVSRTSSSSHCTASRITFKLFTSKALLPIYLTISTLIPPFFLSSLLLFNSLTGLSP